MANDIPINKTLDQFYQKTQSMEANFEQSVYKEEWEALNKNVDGDRSHYKEPDEVAAAVEQALFSENPKRRYMVVPEEKKGRWTITQIMREMVQLNENQAYQYDREALIKLLAEILAADA